uniref:Uncharacterized protein n=1 Tax=Helianthus annuus TaxID=4232 RepID=A0A251TTV0_HELAN
MFWGDSYGIRELARYVMFSSYVRMAMSSKFGSCGFYLDESQVLSCVCFMYVVVSVEQCF